MHDGFSCIAVKHRTLPIVHVVSVPSKSVDDILNNPVMDLIGDAFHSLNIPWAPHVPDIKPEDLPKHVQATSPDLVVLLSEYDVITDNLEYQRTLFRNLFKSIEKEKGKAPNLSSMLSIHFRTGRPASEITNKHVEKMSLLR